MRSGPIVQFRLMRWTIAGLYVAVLFALVIAALVSVWMDVAVSKLTRDPAAIMNVSPFYGTLSKIGILLWCACGTICLFSAVLLRKDRYTGDFQIFLAFSGFISLFLMLDDLFLLHEAVMPKFLHIPETAVFAGYAIIIPLYLASFRKLIFRTEFILLLLALGFFALSIALDLLPHDILAWHYLYEDGLKLFGIVSWFGYFVSTCFRSVECSMSWERDRS